MDLLAFPNEILEQVALHLAFASPTRGAVGPPSPLIPLLLTCRNILYALGWRWNCTLWFRIYISQFDTTAYRRRFGVYVHAAPALAEQLRRTWTALQRLKTGTTYCLDVIDISALEPAEADRVRGGRRQLYDDLWEAYCVASENDGKNIWQLRWAGVHELAKRIIMGHLLDDAVNGWQQDKPLTAMALWVFWVTIDEGMLAAYGADERGRAEREHIVQQILPFVELAYRYQNFLAPDVVFDLPLPPHWGPQDVVSQVNAHGTYPGFRRPDQPVYSRMRFGAHNKLVPPPLVSAAKLIYDALRETNPIHIAPDHPITRDEARQREIRQTRGDLQEINAHKSAPPPDHGHWDWFASLSDGDREHEVSGVRSRQIMAPSAAFDEDWERATTCWDPWAKPDYKAHVYSLGSLIGLWQGRLFVPDQEEYLRLLNVPVRPDTFSEFSPFMTSWPMFMRFAEHHSISPALPAANFHNSEDSIDEGIWNGWLPHPMHMSRDSNLVTIIDAEGHVSRYETVRPGRESSHSEDTCYICLHAAAVAAATARSQIDRNADVNTIVPGAVTQQSLANADVEMADSAPSDEEDGEEQEIDVEERTLALAGEDVDAAIEPYVEDIWRSLGMGRQSPQAEGQAELGEDGSDYEVGLPERTCSGVQDIIFTGETDHEHSMAWGHYTMYGRLRTWDGLIALVRVPSNPTLPRWVFRGYLHYGKVLVGSWRGMTNMSGAATAVPWEGPFVMSRRATS